MSTAQAALWEVKRLLEGNLRSEMNTLSGSYTAGGTSLSFSEAMRSILDGAELEVDSELFRVTAVAGTTATVKGSQRGTTAANHASGANVFVNPRFSTASILSDMNATLAALESEGLYRETAVDITFNPVVVGYDLTGSTTVLDILEVRYKETGPAKRFPRIGSWDLLRNMNTADFPSGNALVLDEGGWPGLPLRIRYAAPFTPIAALTDDLTTTVGLPSSATDLVWLGAAIRGMESRDTRRTFLESQPDTRRSSEVPPGTGQGALTLLRRRFEERVGQERMRLLQRYPYLTPR